MTSTLLCHYRIIVQDTAASYNSDK